MILYWLPLADQWVHRKRAYIASEQRVLLSERNTLRRVHITFSAQKTKPDFRITLLFNRVSTSKMWIFYLLRRLPSDKSHKENKHPNFLFNSLIWHKKPCRQNTSRIFTGWSSTATISHRKTRSLNKCRHTNDSAFWFGFNVNGSVSQQNILSFLLFRAKSLRTARDLFLAHARHYSEHPLSSRCADVKIMEPSPMRVCFSVQVFVQTRRVEALPSNTSV